MLEHAMPSRCRAFLSCLAIMGLPYLPVAPASARATQAAKAGAETPRDGQHDFDFEIGTWRTHLKRLAHPLPGSSEWLEYEGVTTVRKVWNGRANLVELTADGPDGHFEGLNLRLYNPHSRQWSLNFANSSDGTLGQPTIGGFIDGRGEKADHRRLHRRTRRVLRPGGLQRTRHLRPFRDHAARRRHDPLRAGLLGRRRQDLGDQLGSDRYAGEVAS
jgi:hypothetical protein